MRLSLIIPCYNEAAALPALVRRCQGVADPGRIEVILVNNGSTDGSDKVLPEIVKPGTGIRVVHVEKNQGYGFGILSGLAEAKGEILAWTHADLQTDPIDVHKGLALFDRHGDDIFVKGHRVGRPLADQAFTVCMSIFETVLLGARLWDINAQPTMFSRRFHQTWREAPHDFSLDLYTYYSARRTGLPVYRFDVRFPERMHGVSHWNVNWRAKWKFIKRTVDFSLQLKRRVAG